MHQNQKKFSCGNCGADTFKLYSEKQDYPNLILVECTKCRDISEISIQEPSMDIKFGENSTGVICFLNEPVIGKLK